MIRAGIGVLLVLLVESATCLNVNIPSFVLPRKNNNLRHAFATASVMAVTTLLSPYCAEAEMLEWNLLNGKVELPDTVKLDVKTRSSTAAGGRATTTRTLMLRDPTVIGVGGGGAVFRFANDSPTLIKVSWAGSAKSVERECLTLQRLEEANVLGAERCLGQYPYTVTKDKEDKQRVMIAVEPYVRDGVASISDVETSKQSLAVTQVAQTLVQMLAANIITIDVQPLISKTTGEVIFIDMTEAQTLHPPFSFLDTTLMSSFATEMITLIPDSFKSMATKTILKEIYSMEANGTPLSSEAMEVLSSQLDIPDSVSSR
jgi:hypothetical protein